MESAKIQKRKKILLKTISKNVPLQKSVSLSQKFRKPLRKRFKKTNN